MSAFGSGPSNGQFWYGNTTNFPGFLYKKNVGVGGRRSTKMAPGGNITCNSATDLYNKYKPGTGGVGASSTANRRAKNRLATICGSSNKCFPCYNTLGQYSNYTHNPNGFIPCPGTININGSTTTPSGTYTLTYANPNGIGTPPAPTTTYLAGTPVPILGQGGFSRPGFITFSGWNTLANGTGTTIQPGSTLTLTDNTTLYAQFAGSPPIPSTTYTLTYNRNSSQGGTGTAPTAISYSGGSAVPISDNTNFGATGKTFGGWNTSSNGTGTYYPFGSTLTMPYANTILYAQWYNPSGTSYSVIYNGNGNTGGTAPPTVSTYKQYQGISISSNSGSLINGSLTFNGWNTAANGSGTAYPVTSNGFTMPAANVTLYAQWVNTSTNYTLTYDGMGNTGGTVPAPPTSYPSGAGVAVLGQSSLTRTGYNFLGWNTAANGTGSIYQTGSSVVMNANTTLYAQWVGGTLFRDCLLDGSGTVPGTSTYIWGALNSTNVYKDNTNNTITGIIQYLYNRSNTGPYGTGNGPSDTTHSGNIKSSLANVVLSQATPTTYEINITYTAIYTGTGTDIPYTVTANLPLTTSYWPTGQTFNTITTSISSINYTFGTGDIQGSPSFTVGSGCAGNGGTSGIASACITRNQIITSFYINFSNGTSTRIGLSSTLRWDSVGATTPYTYVYNYTRVELASGPTSAIPFTTIPATNTTAINTSNV
jgi:uncharacterized repeat protein (TIGR02543 family)